jgi:hypothetical protein
MTLEDFDNLNTGDRVKFTNPWNAEPVCGTVTRIHPDEIRIVWDDSTPGYKQEMTILRHQVRIYQPMYAPFVVLPKETK